MWFYEREWGFCEGLTPCRLALVFSVHFSSAISALSVLYNRTDHRSDLYLVINMR